MTSREKYAERVSAGLCGWCGKPQHPLSQAMCRPCLIKNRKRMADRKSPRGGPGGRPRLEIDNDSR